MKSIKLSDLADVFEDVFDGWEQYLNIETGRITAVPFVIRCVGRVRFADIKLP